MIIDRLIATHHLIRVHVSRQLDIRGFLFIKDASVAFHKSWNLIDGTTEETKLSITLGKKCLLSITSFLKTTHVLYLVHQTHSIVLAFDFLMSAAFEDSETALQCLPRDIPRDNNNLAYVCAHISGDEFFKLNV